MDKNEIIVIIKSTQPLSVKAIKKALEKSYIRKYEVKELKEKIGGF